MTSPEKDTQQSELQAPSPLLSPLETHHLSISF